jgi:hypothetical protein
VLQRHKEPTTLLREQERWSAVLSRLSVDDVVLAARLNALGDVRIDRLGSGRVFVHVRSRSENGGRPWLVLEAAGPERGSVSTSRRPHSGRHRRHCGQRDPDLSQFGAFDESIRPGWAPQSAQGSWSFPRLGNILALHGGFRACFPIEC